MICYVCKEDLPDSSFSPGLLINRRPSSRICRHCQNEKTKKYRNEHPEKVKQYDADYLERKKEQQKARLAIDCAIKYRGFEKQPCQVCGREDDVEGHHPSYLEENWLTVVWLCPVCHKGVHTSRIDISILERHTAPPVQGRWGNQAVNNNNTVGMNLPAFLFSERG